MIDALFGSKTRIKLLRLFMENPERAFYVREITRLIDEQINSVRRELSNLLGAGVIVSNTADNKLFYEVNRAYEHYTPLHQIFVGKTSTNNSKVVSRDNEEQIAWKEMITKTLPGVRIAIAAGILVRGSASSVDLLLVGQANPRPLAKVITSIEAAMARPINYSVVSYEEFYYRRSVKDRFVSEIIDGKHDVLVDTDNILTNG
jgi:hypothetical protein